MSKLLTKEELKNRVLNGNRGSGQSLRLLIDIYENQIEDLKSDHEHNLELMKGLNDKITELEKENKRYLCKIEMFVGDGITYECFDYDTEYNSWKDVCGEVIAWKEIVPPKGITYSTPLKEQGDWVVRDKEPL